ncbi:MAG: aromatic amino acid transaminase [Simkaniaceae bacterium]|nr:aromatic amino acid transaminase [Simkaniaceae bacterium]
MSIFSSVTQVPDDPILHLTIAFREDQRKEKVNLGVGVYKDKNLKTPRMEAVFRAEQEICRPDQPCPYLPIDGNSGYVNETAKLIFGEEIWNRVQDRVFGAQALGGTGALKIGADFLRQEISDRVFLSEPTWPNHIGIFRKSRFQLAFYPYYDMTEHRFDFEKMYGEIKNYNENDIVVLHTCCHNPSGRDLTPEQWDSLAELMEKKRLIPFFDCAYQGFVSNVNDDTYGIRRFTETNLPILVAVSHSKNFSLYNERVGAIYIFTNDKEEKVAVGKVVKSIIRATYSNPPFHGAAVVEKILLSPELKKLWTNELATYRNRIEDLRQTFIDRLRHSGARRDYSFLEGGTGFFLFTGMSKPEVDKIIEEYGIYMTGKGRINLCGLNESNMQYVVDAMVAVEGAQ